jgi:hypothetical protein
MITRSCFYYGESDTPEEQEEGIAWIDPGDGSEPFPDKVTYRKGVWMSTGLDLELEPVEKLGKVLCVQKLEYPGSDRF